MLQSPFTDLLGRASVHSRSRSLVGFANSREIAMWLSSLQPVHQVLTSFGDRQLTASIEETGRALPASADWTNEAHEYALAASIPLIWSAAAEPNASWR